MNANLIEPARASGKTASYVSRETLELPLARIHRARFGNREEAEDLTGLMSSIDRHGLLQPPVVVPYPSKGGHYILIVGRRRLAACRRLGFVAVECTVRRDLDEHEMHFLSFIENLQRRDPHPLSQARQLLAMKELLGLKEHEIARDVGMSQESVSEYLGICKLPADVQALIGAASESPLKLTHAVALSKLMRTKRLNREVEVHNLARKTVTCRVSSSDLKAHVAIIKGKERVFDRLPGHLQGRFFKSRWMTPALAKLFWKPESFVPGDGHKAQVLRRIACSLTRDQRASFVLRAVKRRWQGGEIKQHFARYLEAMQLAFGRPSSSEPPDLTESLAAEICALSDRLAEVERKILGLADTEPHKLLLLREHANSLAYQLTQFVTEIEEATADTGNGRLPGCPAGPMSRNNSSTNATEGEGHR